jgi:hypothetical protein
LGSTSTSGMISVCAWVIVQLLCSALYSNFQGGHCLTHVGTEGWPSAARLPGPTRSYRLEEARTWARGWLRLTFFIASKEGFRRTTWRLRAK